MASGLIWDDEGNDITMEALSQAVEEMDDTFHPLMLGTHVLFTDYLIRRGPYPNRFWEPVPVSGAKDYTSPPLCYHPSTAADEYVEGIIVGCRTLSNGASHWDGDWEGGTYRWNRRESITAYLVSWHMRRGIARVLPEHITIR